MKEKIDEYIEKRKLTLERTPPEESKKANLAEDTNSKATSSTASKEGTPSGQPATKNAQSVAGNPQGKSK